ncbi:MAG: hypothetical protein K1X74_09680 [Pirellulales bacterium]|nr:hypothetical protein [Pirellulales bacterium]
MNKAFVREPDDLQTARCPRCGSPGVAVGRETLAAQLMPEAAAALGDAAWFCPFPRCDAAYFNVLERVVSVDSLRQPVYPKDPAAPVCPCFGLTLDDIDQDLAEGGVRRVRATIERAKSPEACCLERSPTGRSCIADVQRYYMQRRGGS